MRAFHISSLFTLFNPACFWLFSYFSCFFLTWLAQGSLMECRRSSSQERWTTTLCLISSCESLSVSRNLTLTNFPLSGSLDTLLCDLISLTSGLTFVLPILSTLAVVSFLSGRAYSFLNFLPPNSLRLTRTLICRGQHLTKTTPPRSLSLVFKLLLFALWRIEEPTPFLSPLFPSETCSFWGTIIPPLWLKRYFWLPWGEGIWLGHLLWALFSILPRHFNSSPLLLWHSLLFWHLFYFHLSGPLLLLRGASGLGLWSPTNSTNWPSFSALLPQWTSPYFNFQKVGWDDFTFLLRLSLPFCKEICLSFSFLCCCSLCFSGNECGQFFYSFWPRPANLNPGGPLKWKKR